MMRGKYKKVTEAFQNHFDVTHNVIYERTIFNQRNQHEGESTREFIDALNKQVEKCKYGEMRDELLRDRIVAGMSNIKLSEKLQFDDKLTLKKVLDQAKMAETIGHQQGVLRPQQGGGDVEAVRKEPCEFGEKQIDCGRCGKKHPRRGRCPAAGTECN